MTRTDSTARALVIGCIIAITMWLVLALMALGALAATGQARPMPDPAPGTHQHVTMAPLCPPLAAIPRGWWVVETRGHYVICTGPNR